MDWSPEDRADAYLDGALSRDDARAFERELAERSEVAAALNSALVLRELLQSMPPLAPPAGLEEQIAGVLGVAAKARAQARERSGVLPQVQAAMSGFAWSVRGPALVLGGVGRTPPVEQARWALGALQREERPKVPAQPRWRRALVSLSAPRTPREEAKPPAKPLWRRALALAWKLK